jgi:hypothetical protein
VLRFIASTCTSEARCVAAGFTASSASETWTSSIVAFARTTSHGFAAAACDSRGGRHHGKVERPVGAARPREGAALHRQGFDAHILPEEIDVDSVNLDERQLRKLAPGRGHGEVAKDQAALHHHRRVLPLLRLGELDFDAPVELPRVEAHGKLLRRIAHVARQVDVLELQRHVGAQRVLEGKGLAADVKRRPVHHRRQPGLHELLEVAGQVRHEGNRDIDVGHLVPGTHGAVVEIDARVGDADVAHREARRLVVLRLGHRRQPRQDIARVVMVLAVAHEPHLEAIERHFVHHGRELRE